MKYVTKEEFQALVERVTKLEGLESSGGLKKKKQSIREFILEKKPKDNTSKCCCLLYFLETNRRKEYEKGITSGDLKRAFKDARGKVPQNMSDVLNKCANKGWIENVSQEGKKKLWELTNTGMKHVESLGGD